MKLTHNGFHYSVVPTLNFSSIGDGTATGTATSGGYEDEHQTRWIGDDGFISAANYIQDSSYYQDFSYVIKSGHTIDKWRDYIKRLVHPSGLALFGRTLITGLLATGLKISIPPTHKWPWTIIFHDGDISPAVRLNLQLQQVNPEWPSGSVWPHNGYQNGHGGHSDWHIYEIDIPIILLSVADSEDWLFVQQPMLTNDNFGLITDLGISYAADWGQISGGIGGALQLGPLRRQFDRQKFNKEGGLSKEYGTVPTGPGGSLAKNEQDGEGRLGLHLGGGYRISDFKAELLSYYINDGNQKTKRVMNSHITLV